MLTRAATIWLLLTGILFAESATGQLAWKSKVQNLGQGTAAVADGQIFAPIYGGSGLVSMNASNGEIRWQMQFHDTSPFPPIIDRDAVYVITSSCTLYSVSRATGKTLWSLWLAGSIDSMPTLCEGKIYAASSDYKNHGSRPGGWHLICLEAATGKELWARHIGADIVGAPLVSHGEVYVCTTNGILTAVDTRTGKALWARGMDARSMPALCRDWLVFHSDTGLAAANRKDGTQAWKYEPERATGHQRPRSFTYPMIAGDRAFVSLGNNDMTCLDLERRAPIWTWSAEGQVLGDPVMVGGRVYFGTADGSFLSLNARTGQTLWAVKTDGTIADAPAIMDGKIYVHDQKGALICLDAGTATATGWGCWGGNPAHTGDREPMGQPVVVTPSAADEGEDE